MTKYTIAESNFLANVSCALRRPQDDFHPKRGVAVDGEARPFVINFYVSSDRPYARSSHGIMGGVQWDVTQASLVMLRVFYLQCIHNDRSVFYAVCCCCIV